MVCLISLSTFALRKQQQRIVDNEFLQGVTCFLVTNDLAKRWVNTPFQFICFEDNSLENVLSQCASLPVAEYYPKYIFVA